jgi:hypothetical protein
MHNTPPPAQRTTPPSLFTIFCLFLPPSLSTLSKLLLLPNLLLPTGRRDSNLNPLRLLRLGRLLSKLLSGPLRRSRDEFRHRRLNGGEGPLDRHRPEGDGEGTCVEEEESVQERRGVSRLFREK